MPGTRKVVMKAQCRRCRRSDPGTPGPWRRATEASASWSTFGPGDAGVGVGVAESRSVPSASGGSPSSRPPSPSSPASTAGPSCGSRRRDPGAGSSPGGFGAGRFSGAAW